MAERVYLHIGAPKTGTTFLQDVLLMNRQKLADKGIWYVGERWSDHVHARFALVDHPRLKRLDAHARGAWDRAVAEAQEWPGHSAIISHEMFGSATPEQAARAVADLAPAEVHLVFTARNAVDHVLAVWQEQLKWRFTTPLSHWRPAEDSAGPHSDWSWRTMDPAVVLDRWRGDLDPAQIHVVTVPQQPTGKNELWERFAVACGIPPDLCDLRVARPNKSLGATEAELLRRVNVKLGNAIPDRAEIGRWMRQYLAHTVLVPRGGPRLALREPEIGELTARAAESRRALTAAGYDIVGDLDDLRPLAPQRAGIHPDDVEDAALLDAATATIAAMLLTIKERTEERDAAREKLKVARGKLGTLRARSVGPMTRIDRVARKLMGRATRRRARNTWHR